MGRVGEGEKAFWFFNINVYTKSESSCEWMVSFLQSRKACECLAYMENQSFKENVYVKKKWI